MAETTKQNLVRMVRAKDPFTTPYDPAEIYVDPSAIVAMQVEGWVVAQTATKEK